jgi:hypothetical protein
LQKIIKIIFLDPKKERRISGKIKFLFFPFCCGEKTEIRKTGDDSAGKKAVYFPEENQQQKILCSREFFEKYLKFGF